MNRRGFLHGILATAIAPAIVRSESIMKIWVPSQEIIAVTDMDWYRANLAAWHAEQVEKAIWFGVTFTPQYLRTDLDIKV